MLGTCARTHSVATPDGAKRRSGDQSYRQNLVGSALDPGSPFGWPG